MLEWVYPYPVKMAQLPGQLPVAYVDEGQGEQTLLFLHGLGSYLKGWRKNIDALRGQFRCVALDFPGYGKSSKGNHPYGMSFFAQTVRDFIAHLGLQKVILIGHSMGGQVAITVTARQAPQIQKLILISPAGFESFSDTERVWIRSLYSPTLLKATPTEQLVRNFEINFHRFPEDARFMIRDRMMMKGTDDYDHYCTLIPACVNSMLDEPVLNMLPTVRIPTLVIFGENDLLIPNKLMHPRLTTVSVAEAGTARLPHARLELLRPCGHFAQWEQAEAVNRSIRNFVVGMSG